MTSPNSRLPRATVSSRSPTPTSSPRLYSSPHRGSKTHLPQPKVLPFPDLPVRPTLSRGGSSSNLHYSYTVTPASAPTPASGSLAPRTARLSSAPMVAGSSSDGGQSASESRPQPSAASSTSPPVPSPLGGPRLYQSAVSASASTSALPNITRAVSTPASASASPAPSRTQGFQPQPLRSSPTTAADPSPTGSTAATASASLLSPVTAASPAPRTQPAPVKKSSLPPLSSSVQLTQSSSPHPALDHLYQCFLYGIRADVRIWVRKWKIGWLVHSAVLVQAGGFSAPGSIRSRSVLSDAWHGEDIELTFDDPNITRAAFEICLSRLYSPFPHLHFPISHLPTPRSPLTPMFEGQATSLHETHLSLPKDSPNTLLATPHLLLSLLATSIYLGQNALMREVMAIILRTIGPGTIVRYLGFAIGDGVGLEEWPGQTSEGARGLDVAQPIDIPIELPYDRVHGKGRASPRLVNDTDSLENIIGNSHRGSADSDARVDDEEAKVGDSSAGIGESAPRHEQSATSRDGRTPYRRSSGDSGNTIHPLSGLTMSTDPNSFLLADASGATSFDASDSDDGARPHFYGFVSNKIGEACMCWLSRWATDIVEQEERFAIDDSSPARIFAHRGLPSKFVRALLSSDSLFVSSEVERYSLARKVLMLRRAGWERETEVEDREVASENYVEWEEDESELGKVFEGGIYYTHMAYDDLASIAADVDPSNSQPFAPMAVLQSAHWAAAELKARITAHERSSSVTGDEDNTELGLTSSTTEISLSIDRRQRGVRSRVTSPTSPPSVGSLSKVSSFSGLGYGTIQSSTPAQNTTYHPVPADDTHRIGAGGLLFLAGAQTPSQASQTSIAGLPDIGPDLEGLSDDGGYGRKSRHPPQNESTFFGVLGGSRKGEEIWTKWKDEGGAWASATPTLGRGPGPGLPDKDGSRGREERWSRIEPLRFSVEFWGVEKFGDKERAYSTTRFYAGSWFNVYVQTIRKNNKGVQLGIYLHRQSPDEPFPMPSQPGDGLSSSVTTPQVGSGSIPVDRMTVDTAPYRDTRRVTQAYFSISCVSALGTALIRFCSAPDAFRPTQSWGWKSSALRSEEYLPGNSGAGTTAEGREDLGDGILGWVGEVPSIEPGGKPFSLRASVVVGVI